MSEHEPIKEGSRLTNDLSAILEAQSEIPEGRRLAIVLYLKYIEIAGCFTAEELELLTYASYSNNRSLHPHITPYDWESVYGKSTARMELRFALQEYAKTCAETGSVFHHLGRECDKEN